jgi:hypothetical protein
MSCCKPLYFPERLGIRQNRISKLLTAGYRTGGPTGVKHQFNAGLIPPGYYWRIPGLVYDSSNALAI